MEFVAKTAMPKRTRAYLPFCLKSRLSFRVGFGTGRERLGRVWDGLKVQKI